MCVYLPSSPTHSSCLGRLAYFPSIVAPDAAMYMFLLACEHSPPSLPPSETVYPAISESNNSFTSPVCVSVSCICAYCTCSVC